MTQAATHSTDHGQAYGDWVAPKFDGALLVWPDAVLLPEVARDNRQHLDAADHVQFAGRSLPDWRRSLRHGDNLVIATGHQAELHHVGVWIKNAVTVAVAEACGGVAEHVVVSTDAPKAVSTSALSRTRSSRPRSSSPRRTCSCRRSRRSLT